MLKKIKDNNKRLTIIALISSNSWRTKIIITISSKNMQINKQITLLVATEFELNFSQSRKPVYFTFVVLFY